jgi:hypothetical protein
MNKQLRVIAGLIIFFLCRIEAPAQWTMVSSDVAFVPAYPYMGAMFHQDGLTWAGQHGLMVSGDSGKTWLVKHQLMSVISDIYFLDRSHGIVSHGNKIEITSNGGAAWTWRSVTLPGTDSYTAITAAKFIDAPNYIVVVATELS